MSHSLKNKTDVLSALHEAWKKKERNQLKVNEKCKWMELVARSVKSMYSEVAFILRKWMKWFILPLPIYVFMDSSHFPTRLIQLRSLSLWKYVKYIKEISQFGQFDKEMVILCLKEPNFIAVVTICSLHFPSALWSWWYDWKKIINPRKLDII